MPSDFRRRLMVLSVVLAGLVRSAAAVETSAIRTVATFACDGPSELTAIGASGYFVADDGVRGSELWRTGGTTATTMIVRDIRAGALGAAPADLTALGTRLLFTADDGTHGREPWISDGTDAGTTLLADIRPGPTGSAPGVFTVVGARAFFVADDGVRGRELWLTDGTAAGTRMVADLAPGPASANVQRGLAAGDLLVFGTHDGVWRSDGTTAGTFLLTPTIFQEPLISVGPRAFFREGGVPCEGLLGTDGTAEGTDEVFASRCPAAISAAAGLGEDLYYVLYDDEALHWLDRVPAGTTVHEPYGPGGVPLAAAGSRVFFFRWPELRVADGTAAGTRTVASVGYGAHPAGAREFLVFSRRPDLFTPWGGPWISDGTAVGTHAVAWGGAPPGVPDTVPDYTTIGLTTIFAARTASATACPLAAFDIPGPEASVFDAEALESAGAAAFTVRLAAPVDVPVTIAYSTANATAMAGADYAATSGTVTIPAGATSGTISVPLIADTRDEPNEAFLLTLSSPVNARIARGTAQGVIRDDDGRVSLATPIAVLPYTITKQGRYTLAKNLSTSIASGAAITVASDFVHLDLGGFKIGGGSGAGSTAAAVHATNRKNVTVRGGLIRGFLRGIVFDETVPGASANHVVDGVAIEVVAKGVSAKGANVRIVRTRVAAVAWPSGTTTGGSLDVAGIEVEGAAARILHNDVIGLAPEPGHAASGILARSHGVVIDRNRITGGGPAAGTFGIRVVGETDGIVTENRVTGVETGIAFTDGGDGVTRGNLTSGVTTGGELR